MTPRTDIQTRQMAGEDSDHAGRGAFEITFPVVLRLAVAADLPKLEWFGAYTHYRRLFAKTFADQQQGRRLMLLADVNDFPVGQIFIHLSGVERSPEVRRNAGYLYSLRVLPPFRNCGIGTRLIHAAEALLCERGYRWVTIAVAKDNPAARRLYERLDYVVYAEDPGNWQYVDHLGRVQKVVEPSWLLRRMLIPSHENGSD